MIFLTSTWLSAIVAVHFNVAQPDSAFAFVTGTVAIDALSVSVPSDRELLSVDQVTLDTVVPMSFSTLNQFIDRLTVSPLFTWVLFIFLRIKLYLLRNSIELPSLW